MSENALTVVSENKYALLPAMDLEMALARRQAVIDFVGAAMQKDVHFGTIPGTKKDVLYKAGAEMLTTFFGLSPRFVQEECVEDWAGEEHAGEPFFFYRYRCQLWRGDLLAGEGLGSCNSWERKYRFRSAGRVCPECGSDALKRSNYPPRGAPEGTKKGWWCDSRNGGCGEDFYFEDESIQGQDGGKVKNDNPQDLVNTIDKMAQKRCLSGSTPIVIKTSRGLSRTKISTLARIIDNGNEDVFVPGTNGGWRRVLGYVKFTGKSVKRITLNDGSYILATGEHRFPTADGLKSVDEMSEGDVLFRSKIPVAKDTAAHTEIGWVAGLFIAEGNLNSSETAVRFTLHEDETEYHKRVTSLAERVGATWNIVEKKGKSISLNVHGQGFVGLMKDFVSGTTSADKHFSKKAFNQGRAFLSAMLLGYLSGDGCWTERKGRNAHWRLGFTGQNRELARDLRTVCAMTDLRISLKRSNARYRDVDYPTYEGWIKAPVDSYNQKTLEEVASIENEPYKYTVYDIEVDGDHLFLLGNGIQTHNSLVAATLIAVNASEFFTQDLEDMDLGAVQGEYTEVVEDEEPQKEKAKARPTNGNGRKAKARPAPERDLLAQAIDRVRKSGRNFFPALGDVTGWEQKDLKEAAKMLGMEKIHGDERRLAQFRTAHEYAQLLEEGIEGGLAIAVVNDAITREEALAQMKALEAVGDEEE